MPEEINQIITDFLADKITRTEAERKINQQLPGNWTIADSPDGPYLRKKDKNET